MIKIENLTFTYPGADKPNLRQICLEINKGDFLAIIGNNGCGKSTLCKTLNGLIPHFISGDIEGKVLVAGMDTKEQDVGKLACKVGYVYQDFENQIVRPTVLDDASFACLNYAMPDYEARGREALRMCGLESKANEYIWQLSGGQKHLLALAGAVALSPDILILDEPIAQLDPAHARQIYDVLKELNEKYGKTIIVIEHHTEFIADYCKSVVLMKDGEIIWKKEAADALRQVKELKESNIFPPQITMAAKELIAQGVLDEAVVLPTTIEEGREVFGELTFYEDVPLSSTLESNKVEEVGKRECTVSFDKVGMAYRAVKGSNHKVMKDFNLKIHKGEKIALIGSNGAGKSTLMKLMIGLLKPTEGQVLIHGKDTRACTAEELSREISLVYQNPEEMFIKDSIRADIEYAMKVRRVEGYEEKTQALLKRFHLEEIANRDGRLLSGGQMRRASLAIGIALNPSILLLDEPTANLDIATRREIMKTLNDMKDITETVMIATHDMQLVCDWAERIIVLSAGCLMDDGERNQIFKNPIVTELVGIRPPEIYMMGQALDLRAQCYTVEAFGSKFRRETLDVSQVI